MIKHVATSVVIIVSIYLLLLWGDVYVAIVITFNVMTVNANVDYFVTFFSLALVSEKKSTIMYE